MTDRSLRVENKLTVKRLMELFTYEPDTGFFRNKSGRRVGRIHRSGYRILSVDGIVYSEHRLAVLYMTGCHPKHRVDHVNHESADNRWKNLREATVSENACNARPRTGTKSGHKGVYPMGKGWSAGIRKNNNFIWAGVKPTLEQAVEDRKRLEMQYHGQFALEK